jgi:hypothetical protein
MEIEYKTTQETNKITMNSSKKGQIRLKSSQNTKKKKVREKTQNLFIDRIARGLVAPQLASPQSVK